MSDWTVVESRLLTQPSNSAAGMKFYHAAVVRSALRDLWGVIFNWGAGGGSLQFLDGQAQVEVYSGTNAERRAHAAMTNKIQAKSAGGYSYNNTVSNKSRVNGNQRVLNLLDAKAQGTAASVTGGVAKPKSTTAPGTTFAIDPVATLVSSPMTPALARRIVEEKQGLVVLREKYQNLLDQIETKIEILDGKLSRDLT